MRTFDVVVVGAGPAGEVAAGRLAERGLRGRDRRGPARRRRVLVLGLHAVEGAAAPGRGARRGAPRPRRRRGGRPAARRRRRCSPAATRSSTTSTTARSCRGSRTAAIALVRGRGRLAGERRVGRRRRAARGPPGRRPRRRHAARDAADPGPRRDRRRRGPTARPPPPRRSPTGSSSSAAAWSASRWRRRSRRSAAQVTLIEGERRLLPREEEFACEQVTEALDGARRRRSAPGQKAAKVAQRDGTRDGHHGRRRRRVEGDTLLVALGRAPHTDDARPRRRSGSTAGKPIEVDDAHARARPRRGCTRSATSTAARCSRTWASTRRGSRPTTSSATTVALRTAPTGRSPRA